VWTLTAGGDFSLLARLPSGNYQRISMALAPDGSVFVSSGLHIREIFRVSADGVVTTIARGLGDPEGIAVDRSGALYVAESALHRIIRIVPTGR
jgi:DNA-binding beta-propeller fold protein YncE